MKKHSKRRSAANRGAIFGKLRTDHEEVKGLLEKCLKARTDDRRGDLFSQIRTELKAHSVVEEEVVYRRLMDTREKAIAFEANEEHAVVDFLLAKIAGLETGSDPWKGALTVLKEVLEHHIEEEESEMFTKMREVFEKSELDAMGAEFEEKKGSFRVKLLKLVA